MTDEDIVTTLTYGEASTTEESIDIRPPQTIPPETSTRPDSSTAAPTTTTSTSPIVNPVIDEDQDTAAAYNLHYILPGYVAITAFAVLFVLVALISVLVIVIAVKVFKSQNMNLSAYEYPKIKNEYSLPDVHPAHT